MKIFLFLSTIFLVACNSDDYHHSCGIFKDKDAPRIVGKWNLTMESNNYRISDGSWDSGSTFPLEAEMKLCSDSLGTLEVKGDNSIKEQVKWYYNDDGTIHIERIFYYDAWGLVNTKENFRIIIDELDRQYWIDSLERVGTISKQPVISVSEWKLERK
ncbi:MAG: hypothetical protein ACJAUH_000194 [Saprospiraceae bacterium]|jgi:hypothetical protein